MPTLHSGSYKRKPGRSYSRAGYERAKQHIREGEELSEELGGSDKDVKEFFFSLPAGELRQILNEYGEKFGRSALEWAEHAMPKWRTGRIKMSGLVASRLFSFLPKHMGWEAKCKLVEKLWLKYAPRSNKQFEVLPEDTAEVIVSRVEQYLLGLNLGHSIPDTLKKRFNWLAQNDVTAYQRLLNHALEYDRALSLAAVRREVPIIINSARSAGFSNMRVRRTITVGGHSIEISCKSGFMDHMPKGAKAFWFFLICVVILNAFFLLGDSKKVTNSPAASTPKASQATPLPEIRILTPDSLRAESRPEPVSKYADLQPPYRESVMRTLLSDFDKQLTAGALPEASADLESCKEIMEVDPDLKNRFEPIVYNGVGLVYLTDKRYKEAIAGFQNALRSNKAYQTRGLRIRLHNNLGRSYHGMGDIERAVWHYKKAIIEGRLSGAGISIFSRIHFVDLYELRSKISDPIKTWL